MGKSGKGLAYNHGGGGTNKVTNAYWCPSLSGVESSDAGTPVEEEDMHKQATYKGFDFEKIWIMKEYPELR